MMRLCNASLYEDSAETCQALLRGGLVRPIRPRFPSSDAPLWPIPRPVSNPCNIKGLAAGVASVFPLSPLFGHDMFCVCSSYSTHRYSCTAHRMWAFPFCSPVGVPGRGVDRARVCRGIPVISVTTQKIQHFTICL